MKLDVSNGRRFAAILLAGIFMAAAGCEEKVIRTHNPVASGSYPPTNYNELSERNRRRNQPQGPLERLGDFLFGWMADLGKPAPAQLKQQGPGFQPALPNVKPPAPKLEPVVP